MHVGAQLPALRQAPRKNQLQCSKHPLDIVCLIRRDRFDVIRIR
jgi:hypothetical protein